MRQFNLKGEVLIDDPRNVEADSGRTIYPEKLRMAEPGWAERTSGLQRPLADGMSAEGVRNYAVGERAVRPEREVTDDMLRAAREWLDHLEAGRLG